MVFASYNCFDNGLSLIVSNRVKFNRFRDYHIYELLFICRYLKEVINFLDSNCVEIRIAVGEVIAVVLEQVKDFDSADEWEPDDDLLNKLKELATDSHKFRAKKDRKTQRSVFRDIIRYIEVSSTKSQN